MGTWAFKEAEKRTEEARALEAPFKAAQEELEEALAVGHKEEEEYNGKIADCEKRAETGGVVQKNKAKAELAQLKAEDPLPFERQKLLLVLLKSELKKPAHLLLKLVLLLRLLWKKQDVKLK